MAQGLEQLLEVLSENNRYISQLLPDSVVQEGQADVLSRCSSAQLAALLNHLNQLTRVSRTVVEQIMLVQKKQVSLQEAELKSNVSDMCQSSQTYTIERAELEQLCLALVRCYEQRFGLGELSGLKWYSDSGDTLIERRGLHDGQEFLGLVQDMGAAEARYVVKYRNSLVFTFQSHLWPQVPEGSAASQIVIPRAAYFELLSYHKMLDSDWYRQHYAINGGLNTAGASSAAAPLSEQQAQNGEWGLAHGDGVPPAWYDVTDQRENEELNQKP
jgi:hypothetical protein